MMRHFNVFILITTVLFMGSCMGKNDASIPIEGDIVEWRFNSRLIIKAKLGQRRDHKSSDPRLDHLIYEPEYERFVGQFSINYLPESFPKLTESELFSFEAADEKKVHALKSLHPIEFNLMLNGKSGNATDASPHGIGLDDPNQVKVIVNRRGLNTEQELVKHKPYNTKEIFERELIQELDVATKVTENGVDCYRFKSSHAGKRCFGNSENKSVSGFHIYIPPNTKSPIYGQSKELIYDGVAVEWFTDQKNQDQAKKIDATIWRLLNAWNISPINHNN